MAATAVRWRRFRRPDWLRAPQPAEDGSMALIDHLKELRYRVIVAVAAIVLVTCFALAYTEELFAVVMYPFNLAIRSYKAANPGAQVLVTAEGLGAPLLLKLKIAGIAALIISCPVWLYQLWAFIAPGLLAKEKKYALYFIGSAVPLFLSGIALGYWISPKGFAVMLGFTPNTEGLVNVQEVNKFLAFELAMLMVFGASFLLPVILIALNLVGVLKASFMARYRTVAIFLCFVFGAVATPSTDPFSMCALAVPMAVLYVISEVICRAHDRRVARRGDLVLVD